MIIFRGWQALLAYESTSSISTAALRCVGCEYGGPAVCNAAMSVQCVVYVLAVVSSHCVFSWQGVQRALQFQELKALHDTPNIEESRTIQNLRLGASYVVCWELAKALKTLVNLRLRWAGHVARMGESRNAYRMLVGRPEGKKSLGRPRRRWEDNIRMDLREVGYDDRDWINLAQDRDRWLAYEKQILKLLENKVLRKIFGAKRGEVTGEWRKLHKAELHALYSSTDIIRNIKSRRLRWAWHVARLGSSCKSNTDCQASNGLICLEKFCVCNGTSVADANGQKCIPSDNAGEMSPGSSTESYPAFARVGLRENPGKNLNQVTCPDRDSNLGHLVSQPDALTVTPQVWDS
ncbi:hypothetical protein ANN_21887 [Periplaneta americana]|uniref:Uncharacterized protein n=1 Tax=Periplaneta americana TaxID=6978 RepID=A0ABQ8S6L9_PERAM|nr:hypothetical protein ANN_21887 [Periplaneta americana]